MFWFDSCTYELLAEKGVNLLFVISILDLDTLQIPDGTFLTIRPIRIHGEVYWLFNHCFK